MKTTKREVLPKYKIVFLGDAAVGKTTLITKYVFSSETKDYCPTIGVDFFALKTEIAGKTVNLQLWDTAGQERFRSLIPNYTRDSFMAVILFDLTKKETFERVDGWIDDFVLKNNDSKLKILIVGNKLDLFNKIEDKEGLPTKEEINAKVEKYGASYIETCSLTAEGINSLIEEITEAIKNSSAPEQSMPEFTIETDNSKRCLCL
ncbi:Ras-related protein Rab-6A [Nematocida minor]|uniref:Ras-related protein Rab-6A n=1 Tax=Nematocida minor TaxID=1912983 RepID=UPI00222049D2|nr:Ras-related protein Rab-6A [Nematocida minor]KAI5193055.1 Ras-related protein Rab-6A [Nematocida minor]